MPGICDYPIDETLAIGLDIGIGSVGSAVAAQEAILFAGSRCFEVPEEPSVFILCGRDKSSPLRRPLSGCGAAPGRGAFQ